MGWLLLIGLAYGILIDLLVLTGALVLIPIISSRPPKVENPAAGWIVDIGCPCLEAATPARSFSLARFWPKKPFKFNGTIERMHVKYVTAKKELAATA